MAQILPPIYQSILAGWGQKMTTSATAPASAAPTKTTGQLYPRGIR